MDQEKTSTLQEDTVHHNSLESPSSSIPLDPAAEKALVRKCDLHVLPILSWMYCLVFLDRINIGNAKIVGLEKDLDLHGSQYNVALFVFLIPYVLFEIPSNAVLKKVRPSRWLSMICLFWGVVTVCIGCVRTYGQLLACRFLLGIFEAGFLPGAIYIVSVYYKRYESQWRWCLVYCACIIAGAFGGLFAFLCAKADGVGGYAGWRWIFIIEGLITVCSAVLAFFTIPDWPAQARFLTPSQKALLAQRLAIDTAGTDMNRLDRHALKLILTDWKIYVSILMYLPMSSAVYSVSYFMPTIIDLSQRQHNQAHPPSAARAQILSIPIYMTAFAVTLLTCYLSDRLRHRYAFTLFGTALGVAGYAMLLSLGGTRSPGAQYAALFLTAAPFIVHPLVMTWCQNSFAGHWKRSVGSAAMVGFGNLGGFVGANVFVEEQAPGFRAGYGATLGLMVFAMGVCTAFFAGLVCENRARRTGARDHVLEGERERVENLGDGHPAFRFGY